MTKKISYNNALKALHSIAIESDFAAKSGDAALEKMGRSNLIMATLLIQILSGTTAAEFNKIAMINLSAAGKLEADEPEDNEE